MSGIIEEQFPFFGNSKDSYSEFTGRLKVGKWEYRLPLIIVEEYQMRHFL